MNSVPYVRMDSVDTNIEAVEKWIGFRELLEKSRLLPPDTEFSVLLDFLVEYAGGYELAKRRTMEMCVEQAAISQIAHMNAVKAVDVFGLDDSDAERAAEAAKKRLMRMTKKDMVELIGESVSIMLRFQEFYLRYELLTQTFEQIRGANLATLQLMKDIDAAYEDLAPELERNCRYGRHNPESMYIHGDRPKAAERRFDDLLKQLPDRFWVE